MGKIDHKQINEKVQVVVSPSLAFWPPGNLGPRAQGMKRVTWWEVWLPSFQGAGLHFSMKKKEARCLTLAPIASHFTIVLSRVGKR